MHVALTAPEHHEPETAAHAPGEPSNRALLLNSPSATRVPPAAIKNLVKRFEICRHMLGRQDYLAAIHVPSIPNPSAATVDRPAPGSRARQQRQRAIDGPEGVALLGPSFAHHQLAAWQLDVRARTMAPSRPLHELRCSAAHGFPHSIPFERRESVPQIEIMDSGLWETGISSASLQTSPQVNESICTP